MNVRIKLLASLVKYLPPNATGRWAEVEAPEKATPITLMEKLGIPPKLISLILVNGKRSDGDTLLQEGDEIRLLPPIPGG